MRIAFFTDVYRPTINGVVASIDLYATQLRKAGHTVHIICPSYPEANEDDEQTLRLNAFTFPNYKEYRIATPISLKVERHMREHKYDVIHIHSPFSVGFLGITYAKRFMIPIVYTAHTDYAEYLHYIKGGSLVPETTVDKLSGYFSNALDLTIAPSRKIADMLIDNGVKTEVAILPTGILRPQRGSSARFRKKYGLKKQPLFLYLGRVTKEKNLEFLIDSFYKACQELGDPRLVVVGDGPYRPAIEAQVQQLGIEDKVLFTGFLSGQDKADAYSAADIFCHASYSETQGMTLLEAASYGLPLIVSDDPAYDDVAVANKNSFIVGEDSDEFAQRMILLAGDNNRRQLFSQASIEISKKYSIENTTLELVRLYEHALANKRLKIEQIN